MRVVYNKGSGNYLMLMEHVALEMSPEEMLAFHDNIQTAMLDAANYKPANKPNKVVEAVRNVLSLQASN